MPRALSFVVRWRWVWVRMGGPGRSYRARPGDAGYVSLTPRCPAHLVFLKGKRDGRVGEEKEDAEVKELPILFSGKMVRAILDGTKTQTRRVAHLVYDGEVLPGGDGYAGWEPDATRGWGRCRPGDRLWVRETWAAHPLDQQKPPCRVLYRADGVNWWRWPKEAGGQKRGRKDDDYPAWVTDRWRPSIYMPRWASRITLEVTRVRVEQLQAITEEDARAEGCEVGTHTMETALQLFPGIWDAIAGDSNPWVWVVEFRRLEA